MQVHSVDPGAVTQDVAVYIRYKRSPWCQKGGKVTVTAVCMVIADSLYRNGATWQIS